MAPNKTHVCGCCGKPDHTLKTCKMPGAAKLLLLKSKVAALTNQKAKVRAGQKATRGSSSFKKLADKRKAMYSGSNVKAKQRQRDDQRRLKTQGRGGEGNSHAYADLLAAGFLNPPPKKCPTCGTGRLSTEPEARPRRDRDSSSSLHVRCQDWRCQARFNVTKFTSMPAGLTTPFSCTALRAALEAYTDAAGRCAPSVQQAAKHAYMSRHPVENLFASLRQTEADAAHQENLNMKLAGDIEGIRNVEADGTLIRRMKVGKNSQTFSELISDARAKLLVKHERVNKKNKKTKKGKLLKPSKFIDPKHWMVHVRYAGLCERAGRVTLVALPSKVVAPGAAPAPEAFLEIKNSGLMSRLERNANIFADGAHAWGLLVKDHNATHRSNLRLESVSHCKGQYTKMVKNPRRGQAKLAGTQAMDQNWRWLKCYIPCALKARKGRDLNPLIEAFAFSWQWRHNRTTAGQSLWDALGSLIKTL